MEVQTISSAMTLAFLPKGNEPSVEVDILILTSKLVQNRICDVDILHVIQGTAAIRDVNPSPNLHAIAANVHSLMIQSCPNHERGKLLGMLVWSVVVAAAGNAHEIAKCVR